MKKIIGIIFISLMFCNIGFAEMKQIEFKNFTGNYVETICVDGYKFVIYSNRGGVSMVQFYEVDSLGNISLPAEC